MTSMAEYISPSVRHLQASLRTAVAIVLIHGQTSTANNNAIKVTGFTSLCEMAGEFKKIASYVAYKAEQWQAEISELNHLQTDLQALRAAANSTENPIPPEIIIFVDKKRTEAAEALAKLAKPAAAAAATAGLAAGAIEQTVSVFYATNIGGSSSYCIATATGGHLNSNTGLEKCVDDSSNPQPIVTTSSQSEPNEAVSNDKFETSVHTSPQQTGANCDLSQTGGSGGYWSSAHKSATIKWAAGMLSVKSSALTTNPWTPIKASQDDAPLIKAAQQAIKELKQTIKRYPEDISNLKKLTESDKQQFVPITIDTKTLGYTETKQELTLKQDDLERLREALKVFRNSNKGGNKLSESRRDFLKATITRTRDQQTADNGNSCSHQQPPETKESDCEKHGTKTAEECKKLGCDHDAKNNKCKAKTGKDNTAAGTGGDGAPGAAATTGCAKHKNQPDCEKDKTGDKQNCAWRKGKDGETDEPEKEKCRNGSFLVNNKLVLMAAALVGFIF
uniref:Variant surface glycoprotein (VSG), putative n=1 Tax=Trypanosoma brucei TaxID=5691 RepID=Q57WM9_9TRYP|nr:variant surface glycoprotein (VSG), putative [Trypanosoma brucei]